MPETGPKPLVGHASRASSAMPIGCAIPFGLPFLAVGVFATRMGVRALVARVDRDEPTWILGAMGILFGAAGLWIISRGVANVIAQATLRRRMARWPQEPWRWDHSWDPTAAVTGGFGEQVQGAVGVLFFGLFLAPFNWLAWREFGIWVVVVGLFDLILLAIVGVLVYGFLRFARYGKSRLRFATFPFFLGGSFEASLERAARLRSCRSVKVRLQCVEEMREPNGDSTKTVAYSIYADERTLDPEAGGSADPSEMRIAFPLPKGEAFDTALQQRPPRYWELVVTAETPGVDYAATFLVPIYRSDKG